MFIQFGEFSLKHLLLLIFPIFLKIRYLLIPIEDTSNKQIFKCFNDYLSLTLCGLIHLISKFLSKSDKTKKESKTNMELKNTSNINELYNFNKNSNYNKINAPLSIQFINTEQIKNLKTIKEQRIKRFLYIVLIAFLQLTASIIKIIFADNTNRILTQNMSILLESIFFVIFSMLFLNFSLYMHQYYSLGILFICLLIFLIQFMIYKNNELTILSVFQSFIYIFVYEKLYCLSDIIGKKYLDTYMDGVYIFLFKIGIFGLIPLLVYDTLAYCFNVDIKYHGILQTLFSDLEVWVFLVNLFCYILFEISLWLTIYYFSPCHFIILQTLGEFFEKILSLFVHINDYEKEQKITFMILYPILIFAILVFNEIIILNFCGLNYNTKIYIMKREKIIDNVSSNTSSNSYIDDSNSNSSKYSVNEE